MFVDVLIFSIFQTLRQAEIWTNWMIKPKLNAVLKFVYISEANRNRCHRQILYVSCLYIPQEFCTSSMHPAALWEKTMFLTGEVASRAVVISQLLPRVWNDLVILNKNNYKMLLLSVLQYNLVFLWEEHVLPYFPVDNVHLCITHTPNFFNIPFDV
jgi:muramidase (phage lysozyme)